MIQTAYDLLEYFYGGDILTTLLKLNKKPFGTTLKNIHNNPNSVTLTKEILNEIEKTIEKNDYSNKYYKLLFEIIKQTFEISDRKMLEDQDTEKTVNMSDKFCILSSFGIRFHSEKEIIPIARLLQDNHR